MVIPLIFIFLSCHEKAHDNKELSHESSKDCCESQITIHEVEPCAPPQFSRNPFTSNIKHFLIKKTRK